MIRRGLVRFPYGPGTDIDPVSDEYIAAIKAGDEARIDAARQRVQDITRPYMTKVPEPKGQSGGRR